MRRTVISWAAGPAVALACLASAPAAYAQHHHGHGGGTVYVRATVGYPWPYYFGAYYDPFWYPYPIVYPPYGWYGMRQEVTAAVRIEVDPRDAKVFVDGYYAGLVDDFDGAFQRLRIPPGKHEIQLFAAGYKSLKQTVYLSGDSVYKIKGALTKLAPGEPEETPPVPPTPPPTEAQINAPPPLPFGEPEPPPPPGAGVSAMPPTPMAPPEAASTATSGQFGRLAIRVQPAGAEVYIDGERWLTPDTADRMIVNVAAGRHHIEIHKSGYDSFSTEVDVQRGETTPLNVSLPERGRQ